MLFLTNGMLINGCENLTNFILKVYSKEISDIEIERAKNKFINELLNIQSPNEYLQLIGTQLLYFNKIISKYDFAKKICEITSKDLSNCIKNYFIDKKPSIVYYGPTNFLFPQNSYYSNEIKKRFLNGLNKKI
jgi:predicted Zn-dependent peptidase